jgi:uncharacterized membrane protein YdbT with pleckstrin-like domain
MRTSEKEVIVQYVKKALGKNEKLVVSARRHPIVLFWSCSGSGLFLTAILVVAAVAGRQDAGLFLPVAAVGLLPVCYFVFRWLKWFNEVYFVTTHRVVSCSGIINKRVLDSSLEQVNDVVLSQSWVGRILNFGDVDIMTASEIGVNKLRTVISPVMFKTKMLDQKQALSKRGHLRAEGDNAENSKDLMADLETLRQKGALTEEEFEEKKTLLLARELFAAPVKDQS